LLESEYYFVACLDFSQAKKIHVTRHNQLGKGLNQNQEAAMSEDNTEMAPKEKKIGIEFPSVLRGGVYSNKMLISHTREEFVMDFMMVAPPAGAVTARVIMSPGHLKRVISALRDNLGKYEKKFGPIEAAAEPPESKGKLGFVK
jgi:hypothetical protein